MIRLTLAAFVVVATTAGTGASERQAFCEAATDYVIEQGEANERLGMAAAVLSLQPLSKVGEDGREAISEEAIKSQRRLTRFAEQVLGYCRQQ